MTDYQLRKLEIIGRDTKEARDAYFELVSKRNELVMELYESGYTMVSMAEACGTIYQNVQQIVKRNGAPPKLPS